MTRPEWMNQNQEQVETCERCGEVLKKDNEIWLELNNHTGKYHKEGEVPEEESQGYFCFGKTCAKKVLENKGELVRLNE